MGLPSLCPFIEADTTAIVGNTTDFFGGTGGFTFLNLLGTPTDWQILSNHAYAPSLGGIVGYDAGTPNVNVSFVLTSNANLPILIFRSNSAATQYLQLWCEPMQLRVFDDALTLLGTFTGTVNNGDTVEVQVNASVFTVLLNGTACTGLTNITSSHGASNQFVGIRSTGGTQIDDFNVAAFVVVTPTAIVSIPAPTGNTFQGTSGSSGTGPYTFQWQRSTVPDSGFADLANGSGISGVTTLQLVDGSAAALAATTAATALFYRDVVTDSLLATFNSNVIASVPGTHAMNSLWIWDSIGQGSGTVGPGPNWLLYAPSICGARAVGLTNVSDGGQTTAHWYDSQGSGVQAQLVTDSAAGLSAGRTMAEIRLGINDASGGRIASVYAANLAGMAAYLLGQGYSRVVIHYPTGIESTSIMALMRTYLDAIDALDNGTTIRVGDTRSFVFFSEFATAFLADGTHQNDAGLVPLAILTALGSAAAIGDVPTGGSSGVSGARIFGGF